MGWLLAGVVILGLGALTAWASRQLRRHDRPKDDLVLVQVTATRQIGNWIAIIVEITNRAPSDLHVHAIGLIDPLFGELVMLSNVDGAQLDSRREITVEQTLPPQVSGVEDPCTIIKLALDDPRAFFDTISLTVVVSRRADQSDQIGFDRSARVWLVP